MEPLRYECAPDAPWRLFLFGDVPGLQLDWIWRPAPAATGPTPQHVQHLLALVRLFDAPDPMASTLTVGNLSLGDSRHMPGRGALAILAHFRLPGSRDHSGRPNPPVVVALVAVDADLGATQIEAAAGALLRWAEGDQEAGARPVDAWYAAYVRAAARGEEEARATCQAFMGALDGLPRLGPATSSTAWRLPEGATLPAHIELRADVARSVAVARMAAVAGELYRSRLRWSAISTGQPSQHPSDQGLVLGLVPAGSSDRPQRLVSRLPDDPVRWMRELLGAIPGGEDTDPLPLTAEVPPAPPTPVEAPRPAPPPPPAPQPAQAMERPRPPEAAVRVGVAPQSAPRWVLWSGLGGLIGLLLLLALRGCWSERPIAAVKAEVPARIQPAAVEPPQEPQMAPEEEAPAAPTAPPEAVAPDTTARTPAPRPAPPVAPEVPPAETRVQGPDGVLCGLVEEGRAAPPAPLRGERTLPAGTYTLLCQVDGAPAEWAEQRNCTLETGASYAIRCVGGQCACLRR